MLLYNLIVENKELLKIFYAMIIAVICSFIVYKTNKLFKISLHQGIRYLRNAFLFYGIAFILRYFVGVLFIKANFAEIYQLSIRVLFEYFLIMAGFFLLYSLLWKKIDSTEANFSSVFSKRVFLFHLLAVILAILDFVWATGYFMFFSQIILFSYASIVSFINYKKKGKKHGFPKFYFMAMILTFAAWILNALSALYFEWDQGIMMNIYAINIAVFLLFLYGIVKATKN